MNNNVKVKVINQVIKIKMLHSRMWWGVCAKFAEFI